jgi:hypothetical protein
MTEENVSMTPRTGWRRTLPYIGVVLLLFLGTSGIPLMMSLLFCAFALALFMWQLWMRRARWWWTWAMLAAVLLYCASWWQPFQLLQLITWILVLVTIVGETGRAIGEMRARRSA